MTTDHEFDTGVSFEMSPAGLAQLANARDMIMYGYHWLCHESASRSIPKWPWEPKLHELDHGIRDCLKSRLAMSSHWAYSDESWAGMISKVLFASHAVTRSLVILGRYLIFMWSEYPDML